MITPHDCKSALLAPALVCAIGNNLMCAQAKTKHDVSCDVYGKLAHQPSLTVFISISSGHTLGSSFLVAGQLPQLWQT